MSLKSKSNCSKNVLNKYLRKLKANSKNSNLNPILLMQNGNKLKEWLIFSNSEKSKGKNKTQPYKLK